MSIVSAVAFALNLTPISLRFSNQVLHTLSRPEQPSIVQTWLTNSIPTWPIAFHCVSWLLTLHKRKCLGRNRASRRRRHVGLRLLFGWYAICSST
jgi:hypothetical protein